MRGNPVNIFNGNNYEQETDVSFSSPYAGGLVFNRYYNSKSDTDSTLGFGWNHTFNIKLNANFSGSYQLIEIINGSGRGIYFSDNDQDGTFKGEFLETSTITKDAGNNYIWTKDNGTVITFDNTGRLSSIKDKNENVQSFTYNANNLLETIQDLSSGRALTLHYDAQNKIDYITGPVTTAVADGIWVNYTYDGNNNLTRVEYADDNNGSGASGFEYLYEDANDPNNMTTKKDLAGTILSTWTYDTQDRVINNTNDHGTGVDINYVSDSEIQVTDVYGITSTEHIVEINGLKKITETTKPNGCASCSSGIYKTVFNETTGLATQNEYYNGRIDKYQDFDAKLQPQTIIRASGTSDEITIKKTYHPQLPSVLSVTQQSVLADTANPNREKITLFDYDDPSASGNTDTPNENPTLRIYRKIEQGFTLDDSGNVVAFEHITSMTYNGKGQITQIDGPKPGNTDLIQYAYDAVTGDLSSITRPLVGTTSFYYDAAGNMTRSVDINSIETLYTHDGKNRVLSVTRDGKTQTMTYTAAGKINTATDAENRTLNYAYNSQGLLERITNPGSDYLSYFYDANSKLIEESIFDWQGTKTRTTRFDYGDPLNNPALAPGKPWKTIVRNQDNTADLETVFEYSRGQLAKATNPAGGQSDIQYDLFGRKIIETQKIDAVQNAQTSFIYDIQGNLISLTDANTNSITFVLDDLGRRLERISPDTGTTSYIYDETGNLTAKTNNDGQTTFYTYDDLNRLTSITYDDASQDVIFTYDAGINGMGKLTGASDASGSWNFIYDTMGNRTQEEKTTTGITYITSYTYDDTGNLTRITYPDQRVVNYGYNAVGNVNTVTTTANGITQIVADAITYMPFGPMKTLAFGNGMIQEKTFDLQYRPGSLFVGSHLDLAYAYDLAGNIDAITDNLDNTKNKTFAYDLAGRLTQSQSDMGLFSYTYDPVGNRLTHDLDASKQILDYQTGTNRISQIDKDGTITSFTYDANGNTRTKGDFTFDYFQNNRLASVMENGTTVAQYLYDHQGRRTQKTAGTDQTIYHYDLGGNLIAESDTSGTIKKSFIYLGSQRIASLETAQDINFTVTVNSDDGTAISGVKVYVFNENNAYAGIYATTDETGTAVFEKSLFINSSYKFRADYLNEQFWSSITPIDANAVNIEIPHTQQTITVIQNGSAKPGVKVYLFDENGQYLGLYAVTDANGQVSFNLPETHQYKFRADIMGSQYFSDTITITDQNQTVNLDSLGGLINFTLEKAPGVPLVGIKTYLFSQSGTYLGSYATTSDIGNVTFDVPQGSYKIRCDYLGYQFWSQAIALTDTDINHLYEIAHQDVTVNVNQTFGASISPAENIKVYLFSEAGSYLGQNLTTDATGKAVFNLPQKAFKIRADYLGQQYWSSVFIWTNSTISIAQGKADITLTNQGSPLSGVIIYAFSQTGSYLGFNATTDAQGKAAFILPSGVYKFRADWMANKYWTSDITITSDQATPVDLSTGGGIIDFTLKKDTTNTLEGVKTYLFSSTGQYLGINVLTDTQGNAKFTVSDGTYKMRCDYMGYQFWSQEITVPGTLTQTLEIPHQTVTTTVAKTFNSQNDPILDVNTYLFTESGSYFGLTKTTDANGQVSFDLPQKSYKVRADYMSTQYWTPNFTWTDSSVNITQGQVRVIVKQNTTLLPDVKVYAFNDSNSYLGLNTTTDASGVATFLLPEGTYNFRADYMGNQYWAAASAIADTSADIDLDTGGGQFALTLEKSAGVPIIGAKVYAFTSADSYLGLYETSDDTGKVMFDLPAGSYKFRADYMGYQFWTQEFDNSVTVSSVLSIFHQDVTITVNSNYQTSSPLQGAKVYLFTESGSYQGQYNTTGTNGTVTFSVPNMPYKVRADYLSGQYWSNVFTSTDTSVTIDYGKANVHVTQSGVDIVGAKVYLFSDTGSYLSQFNNTDDQGKAEFIIPAESYKLRVDYNSQQFWSNVINLTAHQENTVDLDLDILSASLTANPFYARFDGEAPVKQSVLMASIGSVPSTPSSSGGHTMFFYINDHLGTPLKVADTNAQIVWSADYTPFGLTNTGIEGYNNRFRFPGQYFDAETGLHYNWHRYYDPDTSRYLAPDPIGLAGGINPFVYVLNNPVNYIDPEGLKIQISGDANETALLLNYLSNIAGTTINIDNDGNVSGDFCSPENYSEIEGWLKEIIESDKLINLQFGDTTQVGTFKYGNIIIDQAFKNPNQQIFSYQVHRNIFEILMDKGPKSSFFTGEGAIAHEMIGHGLDWVRGGPGRSSDLSSTARAKYENWAVDRANRVRKLLGLPLR